MRLAREIATDLFEVEDILKLHEISGQRWEDIRSNRVFQKFLNEAVIEWQAATNTAERTKLKAASLLEEWLPEANRRLHDKGEALPAKVQLATLLKQLSGLGDKEASQGGGGEKFNVTINLGSNKISIEKQVTQKVIDVTPTHAEDM
jgi:hypothetical protein